ncbi:MAG TPA: hypothetical protein VNS58_02055 [Puia sp.]|nr:hypothetical protein [Puia sp.]
MRSKTFLRLFFLVLVASVSCLLFSYSHKNSADAEKSDDCGKCSKKKAQTEFILWESLSRNFLSASR